MKKIFVSEMQRRKLQAILKLRGEKQFMLARKLKINSGYLSKLLGGETSIRPDFFSNIEITLHLRRGTLSK